MIVTSQPHFRKVNKIFAVTSRAVQILHIGLFFDTES